MKKIICVLLSAMLLTACEARTSPAGDAEASSKPSVSSSIPAPGEKASDSKPEDEDTKDDGSSVSENLQPAEHAPPEQTDRTEQTVPTEDWMLLLANSENPIPDGYEPELADVQSGYRMDVRVADAMKQMISDADAQGVDLLVCSAYRPYSSQKRNFDNSVSNYMAQGYGREDAITATKRLIAEPGTSEHQTGLAADIVTPSYQNLDDGYANTAAAKWLLDHAPDYGFILRYPKDKTDLTKIDFEPWHYRYVGVEAAKEISGQGLCLEEYLS